MHDGYFDADVAATYDEASAEMFDPAVVDPAVVAPAVDLLAELAGAGPALELGIRTGRIALPLAQRGVTVHGIGLSTAMVTKPREKPGGQDLAVTIGDYSTTTVKGSFAVAYLVFNTIMNLTTQAAQVACFRNVAAHLEPGGCFVVEVGQPQPARPPAGCYHHRPCDRRDTALPPVITHALPRPRRCRRRRGVRAGARAVAPGLRGPR